MTADKLPIEDILTVKHDVVPLDGADVFQALAEAGYRVVAPDQRGYGKTDRPEAVEDYNILQLSGGCWPRRRPRRDGGNPDGTVAKAWIRHFQVNVKNGILHGEEGTKGAPAWYELSGKIESGGAADLVADGVTGDPGYTPKHPERGLRYHYQVFAHFDGRRGTGHSVGDPPPPHTPRTRIYTFVKD